MSVPAASRLRILLPAVLAAVAVVAGFAALVAASGPYVTTRPASDEPYNLMVEGFRSGHSWLAKEAPPALAKEPNPYRFGTYRPYLGPPWSLVDLSYYRGHLYAYFGVTPAVVLFWPYRILTGSSLHQARAVLLFSVLGYALAVGLAVAAWRRYFPGVGPWAGAAMALLLGSVTTLPVFLVRPGLYEVSISCAFFFMMLCFAALWRAWHRADGRTGWLAAASLSYGLAVGGRPSLLFGAVVIFLPVSASLWRLFHGGQRTPWVRELLATLLPISAVGAGLAAFNYARFADALQFGHDYQLSGNDVFGTRSFDPRFFWDNLRLYFLEPLRWHGGFPFVWAPVCPPLSPGHLPVEFFFGTLTNLPVLLAAGLVPLACAAVVAGRAKGRALAGFSFVLAAYFLVVAVTTCSYAGATGRYLLDFIPALALLACFGFVGLESVLGRAAKAGGPGASPAREAFPGSGVAPIVRAALLAALAYSVAVGWLLALALSAFYRGGYEGLSLLNSGRISEGVAAYEALCRINPDFRGRAELEIGNALLLQGRPKDAIGYLHSAVLDEPRMAAAWFNLGRALIRTGGFREAAYALEKAAALDPLDSEAEADLGVALARLGRVDEAVAHLKAALRIDPSRTQVRDNLQALESVLQAGRKP